MQQQELKHLVRIAKTDLDGAKPIAHALLKIKGVGFSFANMICSFANIDKRTKVGYLNEQQITLLSNILEAPAKHGAPEWILNRRRDPETNQTRHLLLADLTFTQENDIKKLKKIKSFKGIRHAYGQPVRGQRTRSNFRKNKGKVHLGVVRKKVTAPGAEAKDEKKEKK